MITNALIKIDNFNKFFDLLIEKKKYKNISWFGVAIKIKNKF